jgi:hypothetical protein
MPSSRRVGRPCGGKKTIKVKVKPAQKKTVKIKIVGKIGRSEAEVKKAQAKRRAERKARKAKLERSSARALETFKRGASTDISEILNPNSLRASSSRALETFRRQATMDIEDIIRIQAEKEQKNMEYQKLVADKKAKLKRRATKARLKKVVASKTAQQRKRVGKARLKKVATAKIRDQKRRQMAEMGKRISSTVAGKRARGPLRRPRASYARVARVQTSRAGRRTFAQIAAGIN